MKFKVLLLIAFLAACGAQPPASGYIVDRQYRPEYVYKYSACQWIGKVCYLREFQNTIPEKFYFALRNCDEHNNCTYTVVDATQEQYEFYEYGQWFPDDNPETP